jgi:hypothetical protein
MLAAGYAIAANRPLAIILLSLGMGLTLLISAMIRRDLAIRERAFEASELAPPEVARRRGSWLREREVLRLVFLIFLAADIILLVWISRGEV